ncbi:holin [Pseudomonas phage vB_PpuP-Villemi]
MDTTTVDVVVRNAPPITVAGASYTSWFSHFPISDVVQWATLIWVVVQLGFYLYEKYRKWKDERIK